MSYRESVPGAAVLDVGFLVARQAAVSADHAAAAWRRAPERRRQRCEAVPTVRAATIQSKLRPCVL